MSAPAYDEPLKKHDARQTGAIYEDQFDSRHDFSHVGEPTRYYVIASTPRCGSHLLGHTLFQTGVFGFPLEYFNPVNFPRWRERFGTEGFHETYTAIRSHRTSPNGCFGTKLHFSHFAALTSEHRFDDLFPGAKVIRLEREDVLGQAVSLAKARQTKSWIAAQPAQAEPEYDAAAIDRAMRDIVSANASWKLALGRHGWPSIRVSYEDFIRSPGRVLGELAEFVGVDLRQSGAQTVHLPERQGDDTNRAWRARYLAEPKSADPSRLLFEGDQRVDLTSGRKRGIGGLHRVPSALVRLKHRLFPSADLRPARKGSTS